MFTSLIVRNCNNVITSGPLETFFKSPKEDPSTKGDGILYHLRCDLEKLYGEESDLYFDFSDNAMLLMIGILSGIDYLTKIYSSQPGTRDGFTELVKDLGELTEDEAQALYQLRCALVHSVSLSVKSKCNYKNGHMFIFETTDQYSNRLINKLYERNNEVKYRVNLREMKRIFLIMIERLHLICNDINNSRHCHVINKVGYLHSEKILKR
jgi:hypothetical protein